jgi:hypothetical protein
MPSAACVLLLDTTNYATEQRLVAGVIYSNILRPLRSVASLVRAHRSKRGR